MTDNLPESHGSELEVSRFDPVVFTDAGLDRLRSFSGSDLKDLAVEVGRDGGNAFAHIRKCAGLVAWAGWFKFSSHEYVDFVAGLADALGFESDTVLKWRREVVKSKKLPVPGVAKVRSDAAIASRKPAGQTASAGQPSGKSAPIPATFTEVPSKKSEEGDRQGETPAGPRVRPSSGPLPKPPPVAPQGVDDAGGSGTTPATPDDTPPSSGVAATRLPSDRELLSRVVAAMRDMDPNDAGPVVTTTDAIEIRQWCDRTLASYRKANKLTEPALPSQGSAKPPQTRRQGTISRPAASPNGKREVTPMFKGGK